MTVNNNDIECHDPAQELRLGTPIWLLWHHTQYPHRLSLECTYLREYGYRYLQRDDLDDRPHNILDFLQRFNTWCQQRDEAMRFRQDRDTSVFVAIKIR